MAKANDLREVLEPFYQRASQAEDRLGKLEAALSGKQDAGSEELIKTVSELHKKLEDAKADHILEREKALKEVNKLAAENAKFQYRITHLVRALKEADCKLASG